MCLSLYLCHWSGVMLILTISKQTCFLILEDSQGSIQSLFWETFKAVQNNFKFHWGSKKLIFIFEHICTHNLFYCQISVQNLCLVRSHFAGGMYMLMCLLDLY